MSFKKWDIYRANLDPVIGSEQGKSRPVLIISEDYINELLNIVNVLPITSRKFGRQIYPNETLIGANKFGLENESIVLCHQIRTLDKRRLSNKFGEISTIDNQNEIMESLCFQLGIDKNKWNGYSTRKETIRKKIAETDDKEILKAIRIILESEKKSTK